MTEAKSGLLVRRLLLSGISKRERTRHCALREKLPLSKHEFFIARPRPSNRVLLVRYFFLFLTRLRSLHSRQKRDSGDVERSGEYGRPLQTISAHPTAFRRCLASWVYVKSKNGGRKAGGKRVVETAADLLIDRLIDWGVREVFGLPGDGINGIMEALRKRQDNIRFVHVRHEEAAAFMACAYAKFTGRLGVCLAT